VAEKPLAVRVTEALAQDKRTRNMAVDVSVIGAHVTLTGICANAKERKMVEDIVRSVSGVTGVINEMRVGRTT